MNIIANAMKTLFIFFMLTGFVNAAELDKIKNFSLLSPVLASAGMPTPTEFELLQQSGYQHIINLIPGNFSKEQSHVNGLSMSFEQIAVDWDQPTLQDFQHFVGLMDKYKNDKVFLHCRLNYRASVFAYLFQTTQLGVDEATAKQQMQAIWEPNDTWLVYISMVQKHYANSNSNKE